MHKWKSVQRALRSMDSPGRRAEDVDARLYTYYGPALPEQVPSPATWLQIQSRLGRPPVRRRRLRLRGRCRRVETTPTHVQEAFHRIAIAAHLALPAARIGCVYRRAGSMPTMVVRPYRRRVFQLALPTSQVSPPELDVLLASGLARYLLLRGRSAILVTLCASVILLGLCASVAGAILWWRGALALVVGVSVPSCAGLAAFYHWYGRRISGQADRLMVQWIGRERACRGLHALAMRTRHPARRLWSDLSLYERIERVCGTGIELEEERATLVR